MSEQPPRSILVIDVGGTSVKIQVSAQSEVRKRQSGPEFTPRDTVDAVREMAADWSYDAISLGFPGPVRDGRPVREPRNLGEGWVDFDYEKAFGCPVLIINDAAMQALGSFEGGKMLFLGLGTGLGSAIVVDGRVAPTELAHLPYKKGMTFEDYVGKRGLERLGKKRWRAVVDDVVEILAAALQVDYVVLGGGNAKKLDGLPPGARVGSNANAFVGGRRLWEPRGQVAPARAAMPEVAGHSVGRGSREGFELLELESPEGLVARYAPAAGMICCSLLHRGTELLGQRRGLRAYASEGAIMGIPLLHPWANRLARSGYTLGPTRVEFPQHSPVRHDDGNGLPIHGLLAGCSEWEIREHAADSVSARLVAELDVASLSEVIALFPFPHELHMEVVLRGATLDITTTLRATGGVPVPVAFGYHPYFQLPDVPRAQWDVALPVRCRALLDERFLPTGETEALRIAPGPLGNTVHDDLFPELEPEPVFALSGGGRRVEVRFGDAFPIGVVYAPSNDDVICFEPMTAPTNPFDGGAELVWVEPGELHAATFTIRVDA